VSPMRSDLGFYIPEDGILHSHCRDDLESYKVISGLILSSIHILKSSFFTIVRFGISSQLASVASYG
jgi:hypothetical protein